MSDLHRSLNRLAKWRAHFAGWQLGTRSSDDPESQAVRDHRETTIMLRAEMNAFVGVLVKKGLITTDEFEAQLAEEADQLEQAYQRRWPGARASVDGMVYNPHEAFAWMQGWKP
jgi:hypothetical protein